MATLREVGGLSPEAFEAWQQRALAAHLDHVRTHMPWFREHAPVSNDLTAWPILRRGHLQEEGDRLRDHSRPVEELLPDASGGSTGKPVNFFHDADYWQWEFAAEVWMAEFWGVKPWSKTAYLWGVDHPETESFKARLERRLLGHVLLNVFDLDDRKVAAYAETLRRERPPVIQGYAGALEDMARHLLSDKPLGYRPRLVRSAAETLTDERRQVIDEAFGTPVCDTYGSREVASMAVQGHDGAYYVLGAGKLVEIVDDDGQPCPPGVPGRVLVTDLTNKAFGFVRYENGDVASLAELDQPALPYPALQRVHGRITDFIRTPDGRRIHGEWFTHLFYGVPEVKRFQVRQTRLDEVRLLTEGDIATERMEPLLAQMRERLGEGVALTWEPTDQIPRTPSGKYRFTVCELPPEGST